MRLVSRDVLAQVQACLPACKGKRGSELPVQSEIDSGVKARGSFCKKKTLPCLRGWKHLRQGTKKRARDSRVELERGSALQGLVNRIVEPQVASCMHADNLPDKIALSDDLFFVPQSHLSSPVSAN